MSEVRYESAPDVAMDVDDGASALTDPSVRRRGRGFGARDGPGADGVRASGFERLAPADLEERAAKCASRCG